jgi:cytochrome c oxidase subunit II
MRDTLLVVCGVVAAGVFATMYLAIWSTRDDPARAPPFRQQLVSEIVWATIPLLMLLAAAIPATVAIISTRAGS